MSAAMGDTALLLNTRSLTEWTSSSRSDPVKGAPPWSSCITESLTVANEILSASCQTWRSL